MSAWFYAAGKFTLRKILGKAGEAIFLPGEILAARWLLGTFILGLVWFALGWAGLFRPALGRGMIFVGLGAAAWLIAGRFRRPAPQSPAFPILASLRSDPVMVASAALFLWVAAWSALCVYPQYYSDTLMINLALPGYYAAEGAFRPNPYHVYSYFHQNSELLTTWALLAGSKEAAQLQVWGFFAAMLILLQGWISRLASPLAALCALAIYVASDSGIWAGTLIKNDLQVGIFILMSWWALQAGLECADAAPAAVKKSGARPETGWRNLIFLSGLCAGISLGHKFNAAPSVLATGVGLILWFLFDEKTRGAARTALGFWLAGLALAWSPWLIRTAALTGNPVYPFLNPVFGIFGGLFGAPELPSWLTHPGTEHNLIRGGAAGLIDYFRNFAQIRPRGAYSDSAIWWGPTALLCVTGLAALTPLFSRAVRAVTAMAAAGWALTLIFAFKPHVYEGPMVYILCVAFGAAFGLALDRTAALEKKTRVWLAAAVLLTAGAALIKSALTTNLTKRVALSAATMLSGSPAWHFAQGVQSTGSSYSEADEREWVNYLINRYSEPGEKVLYMGTVFPAGIERKHYAGLSLNLQPILDFAEKSRDAADLRDRLLAQGIRHIVYDPGMWKDWIRNVTLDGPHNVPVNPAAVAVIDRFMAEHVQTRFKTPSEKLFWHSVVPPGAAPYPPTPILADDVYRFPYHYFFLAAMFSREGYPDVAVGILETYASLPFDRHIEANVAKLLGVLKPASSH